MCSLSLSALHCNSVYITSRYRQVEDGMAHRRRINIEEKAKDVDAVWGTEFIKFLAALSVLHYRTI